jgi:hypothetical protein
MKLFGSRNSIKEGFQPECRNDALVLRVGGSCVLQQEPQLERSADFQPEYHNDALVLRELGSTLLLNLFDQEVLMNPLTYLPKYPQLTSCSAVDVAVEVVECATVVEYPAVLNHFAWVCN